MFLAPVNRHRPIAPEKPLRHNPLRFNVWRMIRVILGVRSHRGLSELLTSNCIKTRDFVGRRKTELVGRKLGIAQEAYLSG